MRLINKNNSIDHAFINIEMNHPKQCETLLGYVAKFYVSVINFVITVTQPIKLK